MSKRNQMIGRRGEKRFSSLCSDHEVTCNGSEEDDNGWDKLIEFAPRPQPRIALDMRSTTTRALVQVKATEGAGRTVSFSLDNALRYAKSELPTFVVLAVIDGERTAWYAKHVWTHLIGAWLLAGRRADADGILATNRETVSLTFDEGDRHDADLLQWIEREIAAGGFDYARHKEEIVRTVGFGRFQGSAQATIISERPHDFIDLLLGLKESLRLSRFTYTSERFGIRARNPEVDETDVILSVTPEGKPSLLTLSFPGGRRCTVPARLYGAHDGEQAAWRISATGLDIVVGPGARTNVTLRLAENAPASLDELLMLALLREAPHGARVELELRVDGEVCDVGSISMVENAESGWPWFVFAVDVMAAIATWSGQASPQSSMRDLRLASDQLDVLVALAGNVSTRLRCTPEPDAPDGFVGFLGFCTARVGDRSYGLVARRQIGLDQWKEGQREFFFKEPAIVWASIDAEESGHKDRMVAAYKKELNRLSEAGEVLALGDIRLIVGGSGDHPLTIDRPGE